MIFCNIHTHENPSEKENSNQLVIVNHMIRENESVEISGKEFCSVGIHPWYITNEENQWQLLLQEVNRENVIAIGEAGLDKLSDVDFNLQTTVFRKQAFLASEMELPLLIHCVKAWDELLQVRKEVKPQNSWIIHGFRGNGIQAGQLLKAGLKLSFGLYFNPEALSVAWPDSFFTETDDKKVSIETVYNELTSSLKIPLSDFAGQVYKNVTQTFFR